MKMDKKVKKLSIETEKMYDLNDVQLDQIVGGKKKPKEGEAEEDKEVMPDSYPDFTTCHTTTDNYSCFSCMTCNGND